MSDRPTLGASRQSKGWNHYLPMLATIIAGVGFSAAVFFAVRWWESRDIEATFRFDAEDRAYTVKMAFETELAMLELVRSSLIADGRVERKEFGEMLVPFHSHNASIEAVEWIPRVLHQNRQSFETAARRDGFENFQITETDKNGKLVRAEDRDEYYPLYYAGPRPADKVIVGYDVASEQVRLKSLEQSRDSGKATASGRIDFIQDAEHAGGFLVSLPVYEQGKPVKTVADRRRYLQGFIMGVFRPQAMLDSALAGLQPAGINIGLFDASEKFSGRPKDIHETRRGDNQPKTYDLTKTKVPDIMHYEVRLDVAGHPWTIACVAAPDFMAAHRTRWPWAVLAIGLAFTALSAGYLSSVVNRRAYLEKKVLEQTADVRQAQEEVICRLVSAAQWSDEETGMHIRRTGLLSEALARAAGWFGDDLEAIRQAAPMHDVGKIGIPDAILQKPDSLTPAEFEVMKTHTRIGADILSGSKVPMLQMARDIALDHHERWDGAGYPRGLAGKAIPEAARIVAIVDVYDALTHDRVYRPAMPEAEALAEMRRGAGTHFDPSLLSLFFLHLSELRNIMKRNPDDMLKQKTPIHNWGGVSTAAFGTSPQKSSTSPLPPLPSQPSAMPPIVGIGNADTSQTAGA